MKKLIIILFVFQIFISFSQNNEFHYPNFIHQNLSAIENNPNWFILTSANGNLINDKIEDVILVLELKNSDTNYNSQNKNPRILLILLNDKTVLQNNKFIALGDEGGMLPYLEPELSIVDNQITISYQYTRGSQSYTFILENNKFPIIKAESIGVHSASGDFEHTTYDFINHQLNNITGNISTDDSTSEIIKLDSEPKCLSEFGKMYDWEVTQNKYL